MSENIDIVTFEKIPVHLHVDHETPAADGVEITRDADVDIAFDGEDVTLGVVGGDCLHLGQAQAFDLAMTLIASLDPKVLLPHLESLGAADPADAVALIVAGAKRHVAALTEPAPDEAEAENE